MNKKLKLVLPEKNPYCPIRFAFCCFGFGMIAFLIALNIFVAIASLIVDWL